MSSTGELTLERSPQAVNPTRPYPSNGRRTRRPRILLVTPELSETQFLARDGKSAPRVKAGGLADVTALLADSLSEIGADVHVALPHFRTIYQPGPEGISRRLHLCHDREFFYRQSVYDGGSEPNTRAALAFQRDVIHYVLPRLRPDLVHCNDWMTGLVPAAARSMGIPSLFSVHNLHDEKPLLSQIEDRGIDAASFWKHLYFQNYPDCYENTRHSNPVSMLASGILAADQMNTVSQSFLNELAAGGHGASWPVVDAVRGKLGMNHARGIINSLPAGLSPEADPYLTERYDSSNHAYGKKANKRELQRLLGLEEDEDAPILFWPSRLDPVQKGCQLLADILYRLVSDYWGLGLQVVFVADGPFQQHFQHIAEFHGLQNRIAVRGFSENLSRMGYAASDYILVPSTYEPCGLAQMIGCRYGSLPIVHATGGLRDTITPLVPEEFRGNGFPFSDYCAEGLRAAIDAAILFHLRPAHERASCISRVMDDATRAFRPQTMIEEYLNTYRSILGHALG